MTILKWKAEMSKTKNTTYKRKGNPLYIRWSSMMNRCYIKTNKDFKYYGGRGITVCDEWRTYENFYDDMIKGFKKINYSKKVFFWN